MLSHVLRTITRNDLLGDDAGRRILCAVSGGPDSMALLACLWELAPRLNLALEVATVDHGLRPEAAVEMALVAERAAALDLPWHPVRVDVAAGCRGAARDDEPEARRTRRSKPGGLQEVARRLRLQALTELARARNCDRIALGHNADDQAETILFRLLRGTGLKGLAGIPYRRELFVRPLLDVTRAQILSYLARRSLLFANDPSNADVRYARARLRHRILPLLRRENPRVGEALRSLGRAVRDHLQQAEGGRQALPALAAGTHIPMEVLAEIRAAARSGHGTRTFDIPRGQQITVAYGAITSGPRETSPPAVEDSDPGTVTIPGPGTFPLWKGWELRVRDEPPGVRGGDPATARHQTKERGMDWAWFAARDVAWPLLARRRRPGDRMRPRGGAGSRKLSDLLIDAKIVRSERSALPVVETVDGHILFVPGLRPSEIGAGRERLVPGNHAPPEPRIGLAIVPKSDHDALVDHSILKGNTGRRQYQGRLLAGPDRVDRVDSQSGNRAGRRRLDVRSR